MLYINKHMYLSAQLLLVTPYLYADTVRLMLAHNMGFPPSIRCYIIESKCQSLKGF